MILDLLADALPARIETDEQYDAVHCRFGQFFGNPRRTLAEKKVMDLLGVLMQDYDRRNALRADQSSPAEILQYLVEQSGKSATELLSPVFGQSSSVSEALSGKLAVSAEQALRLGKVFHVNPELFII
jgi:antitoxin component HigA of HigAB toxin-antitoxin module